MARAWSSCPSTSPRKLPAMPPSRKLWRSSSPRRSPAVVRSPGRIPPTPKHSRAIVSGASSETRNHEEKSMFGLKAIHAWASPRNARRLAWLCATALVLEMASVPARAEVSEVRISKQPSIIYLPLVVMEQNKLLEKRAKTAGLGDIKASWITFNSGGASTDELLAGNVDLVTSGVSNLLLLWERTKGEVNGVTSVGGLPMLLVTRDPAVKTLKDFSAKDKIAVP